MNSLLSTLNPLPMRIPSFQGITLLAPSSSETTIMAVKIPMTKIRATTGTIQGDRLRQQPLEVTGSGEGSMIREFERV